MNGFQESQQLTTRNLPIGQRHFHYEIDDEAFERFHEKMRQQIDQSKTVSPNYKRIFAKNYRNSLNRQNLHHLPYSVYKRLRQTNHPEWLDFSFSVIFFKKVVIRTQSDNYVRLILNCLNVLFIWFDISILDLYAHLQAHFRKFKLLICGRTSRIRRLHIKFRLF